MKTFIRLLHIIHHKKRYMKLGVPLVFFFMEVLTALVLNWKLFGEKYEFHQKSESSFISVHNPLIVIKAVHSDRLTHPYGESEDEVPLMQLYSPKYMVKALCFMASLLIAYMGIFISLLWVKRFFHHNSLNIKWWLWPTACLGAHVVLFLMANSSFGNIFLKQF